MSAILEKAPEFMADSQAYSTRVYLYGLWIAVSLIAFWRPCVAIVHWAAQNDDASHIFLIPFVSAFVIYLERRWIFRQVSYDFVAGLAILLAAAAIGGTSVWWSASWDQSYIIAADALTLVLLWIGGFVLFFGGKSARLARFSLLLLLLAVPLPDFLLHYAVYFLQKGSAEVVDALFNLTGVPFLRQGFVFQLSTVSIEIAEECSGIRSSVAVLILALLAGHFCLRAFWRQSIFIAASLLIMIVKNGVRIATLTLLSIYVSPSFLFGRLHHDGGVVFFVLGLVILVPILWVLVRGETTQGEDMAASPEGPGKLPETLQ